MSAAVPRSLHQTVEIDEMAGEISDDARGTALEPFGGTETTGLAACLQGFNVVLIEQEEEYIADIKRRLAPWIRKAALRAEPEPSQQDIVQTSKI